MRSPVLLALVLVSAFASACEAVDDGLDPGGDGDLNVSENVVAATGGTVEAGGVTLVIPANSLTADTDITIVSSDPSPSLPMYETVRGKVYDLGPDGQTFEPAATLTLPVPQSPGEGETVVVSWLDSTGWNDLPANATPTQASAAVEHFTTFAIRFVADQQ